MPRKVTHYYQLSGWQVVTIYTEQEMADALKMTCEELRDALESGKYGLSYHAHPLATENGEYEFLPSSYKQNIQIWDCIKAGGHHFKFARYYDERQKKGVYKCTTCPYEKYDSPNWQEWEE